MTESKKMREEETQKEQQIKRELEEEERQSMTNMREVENDIENKTRGMAWLCSSFWLSWFRNITHFLFPTTTHLLPPCSIYYHRHHQDLTTITTTDLPSLLMNPLKISLPTQLPPTNPLQLSTTMPMTTIMPSHIIYTTTNNNCTSISTTHHQRWQHQYQWKY